ncbi:MAG: hypothetical protein IKQ62_08385 [Bacteroidaceae bacterium]|nr:hypothetical protein [Bacteroidaceae bacterium]
MTINNSTWFRRIITFGHPYKQSMQRKLYEDIADTCGCSPDRVYEIAHGAKCKSFADDSILSELKRMGIVKRG